MGHPNPSISSPNFFAVITDFAEDVLFKDIEGAPSAAPRCVVPLDASAVVCTFTLLLTDDDETGVEIPNWPVGKDFFSSARGIAATPTDVAALAVFW